MKMWSEGLGNTQLKVDFSHYKVVSEGEKTIIQGITISPVQWEFKVTFLKDDLPGLLNALFKLKTLWFILKNMHHLFILIFEKIFRRERYEEGITKQ